MVLAIICFALEMVSAIVVPLVAGFTITAERHGSTGSRGVLPIEVPSSSNIGTIYLFVYLIFAGIGIGCIIYNAIKIKKSVKKGRFVTGLVFSIIDTSLLTFKCWSR